jgi:hypothetical protein
VWTHREREAKLWRNPEARRQVVGQVLDYAKELARWSYEELQGAVRLARSEPDLKLYDLVCGPEAAPEQEAAFVDGGAGEIQTVGAVPIAASTAARSRQSVLGDLLLASAI